MKSVFLAQKNKDTLMLGVIDGLWQIAERLVLAPHRAKAKPEI